MNFDGFLYEIFVIFESVWFGHTTHYLLLNAIDSELYMFTHKNPSKHVIY